MRTQRLGSQGPEISVVGFGAWEAGGMGWGQRLPDDRVIAAIEAGFDAGINWIDTAEVYGGGRSEELVGQAVKGRDDVLVFTKLAAAPAGTGFAPEQVRQGAEQSLQRLDRDAIDLYQLHWPDDRHEVEKTWEAMAGLVEEGLVRYIGVSNFDRALIERCERVRHVDSLQPHFSMLFQRGRDDLFPFCKGNGTGIICYGPLAFGLLTGAITRDTEFDDEDWRGGGHGISYYPKLFAPGKLEANLERVESLRPVADRLGVKLAQLALAWVFHREGVTGAIAGSTNPDHVRENAAAGGLVLEEKDLDEIDSILS